VGMAFFKKRKDDEDDEEYEEEELYTRRRKPRDKDFKDLKSENKKHRKEPKKPWGKKERYLISATLLFTIGVSGILAMSARSWKLPGLPRISFSTFTLPNSLFSEETIILEGDRNYQVNQEFQKKMEEITSAFKDKTKDLSGIYGLYVINLNNGASFGVNENEKFQAASLIKLPVMAGMYIEDDKGNIDLDEKYTLRTSDKVKGAGSLYSKPAGYKITYRNLVELMGKQSDNTAFNIFRRILGEEKIGEIIGNIGMMDTSLNENITTPRDIGIYFEKLWRGNIVNDLSRDELLDALTDTIYEDWLIKGIPKEVRVAHKYGRELHVVNDAGIVFAEKPFVIVIMSKGVVEAEADKAFPELTKIVYDIEIKNGY